MIGVWIPAHEPVWTPERARSFSLVKWLYSVFRPMSYFRSRGFFNLHLMQNKTKLPLSARLSVRTKHSGGKCLSLKKATIMISAPKMKSKTNVVAMSAGLNEATCYKVPVCLCFKVQTSGWWDAMKRRSVHLRILGECVSLREASGAIRVRKRKTLNPFIGRPHSSPPSVFVFRSIHPCSSPFTWSLSWGIACLFFFLLCVPLTHFSLLFSVSLYLCLSIGPSLPLRLHKSEASTWDQLSIYWVSYVQFNSLNPHCQCLLANCNNAKGQPENIHVIHMSMYVKYEKHMKAITAALSKSRCERKLKRITTKYMAV